MSRLSEILNNDKFVDREYSPKYPGTQHETRHDHLIDILKFNGFTDDDQIESIIESLIKNYGNDCFDQANQLTP